VSSKKSTRRAKAGKAAPQSSGVVVFITVILPILVLTTLLVWMLLPDRGVPAIPGPSGQATFPLPGGLPPSTATSDPTATPPLSDLNALTGTPKEKAALLVEESGRLFAEGRMDEALARYDKALEFDPEDEEIYFGRGSIFARAGKNAEAMTNYLRAIEIFPGYAEAKNNLGNLYVALGRFDDAIPMLESVVELRPDGASGFNNLGTALARKQLYSDAARRFEEAIRLQPDYAEAHVNLGMAHLSLGSVEKATNSLNRALALKPDLQAARQGLARAMKSAGSVLNSAPVRTSPPGGK
jgi:tetratricopeptide (TPR) repeat protein